MAGRDADMSLRHVLVGDDHAVTRRGIREFLCDEFADVEVVEAGDGNAVLEQLGLRPWDLILLDIRMPGPNVLDVIAQIRVANAVVPILILTAVAEIEYVVQTVKAGANGIIHKHRASDELLAAIKQVAGGEAYVDAETAIAIARGLTEKRTDLLHERLSEREYEVFRLIALGRAIKEIAGELNLSEKTVATYFARIREKTGLDNYVQIARYALQNRLVD